MKTIDQISNQEVIEAVKNAKRYTLKEIWQNQSALVSRLQEIDGDYFKIEGGEINFDNAKNYESGVLEHLRDLEVIDASVVDLTEELYSQHQDAIEDFLMSETDSIYENREFYEAYSCSDWFLSRVRAFGGLTANYADVADFWLRQTTGQSIDLDGLFHNIVFAEVARTFGVSVYDLEEEIKKRKLNNGSEYLSGFVCNIESISSN